MNAYERRYRGQDTYTVTLFDREWDLPLVEVDTGTYIASNARLVLGTTRFVEAAAEEFADQLTTYDPEYLVTPEAKALPLTQALARRLDVEYVVVRKNVKEYMRNPLTVTAESITTAGEQKLVLDGRVTDRVHDSRVVIVDDAVSTGGTIRAIEALLDEADADVVASAAVFEEGREHAEVHTLASLPLFVET